MKSENPKERLFSETKPKERWDQENGKGLPLGRETKLVFPKQTA